MAPEVTENLVPGCEIVDQCNACQTDRFYSEQSAAVDGDVGLLLLLFLLFGFCSTAAPTRSLSEDMAVQHTRGQRGHDIPVLPRCSRCVAVGHDI